MNPARKGNDFGVAVGMALGLLLQSTFIVLTEIGFFLPSLAIPIICTYCGFRLGRKMVTPKVTVLKGLFALALVFIMPICWLAPFWIWTYQAESFVKKEIPIYQIAEGKVSCDADAAGFSYHSIDMRFYAKKNYSYNDIVNFYRNNFISKGWKALPIRNYREQEEYFDFLKNRRVVTINIENFDNRNYVCIETFFPNLVFHPDRWVGK